MKIQSISIFEYQKSFNFQFTSSHLNRTRPDSLIVRFDFDNGLYGLGETTPREYVTGETCATVIRAFQDHFAPVLLSTQIHCFDDVVALLDTLEKKGCTDTDHCNAALTAVDLTLMDALGKQQARPAGAFLGEYCRDAIPYALSVPFFTLQEIEAIYPMFEPFNIGFIKVIVGHDNVYNLEKLKLVRSLIGDEAVIHLEANGHLSLAQALAVAELAEPYDVTGFEQPLAAGELDGLVELRKKSGLAIILDESVCTIADVQRYLEYEAVDIVNVKIAKCGGLVRASRIAALARRHDKMCHLGAHVGETAVLTAAGLHFAMTIPNIRYFEGFSFMLFQEWRQSSGEGKLLPDSLKESRGLGVTDEAYRRIRRDCLPVLIIDKDGKVTAG